MDTNNRPQNLWDSINQILYGTSEELEKLEGKFFYLADTPQFMKNLGLSGNYFSIRYGVIARHSGKDTNHNLSEENWQDICEKIVVPFAIAKYSEGFRLFLDVKVNNRWAVIGIGVKNIGRNLEVNAITTAFGYDIHPASRIKQNYIYISPKITPEQRGLLDGHNSLSLPSVQERNLSIP
jgi:hypothetical protein